jgi:hypothetical protein
MVLAPGSPSPFLAKKPPARATMRSTSLSLGAGGAVQVRASASHPHQVGDAPGHDQIQGQGSLDALDRAHLKLLNLAAETAMHSQPLVYELDAGLKPVRHYYLGRSAALL